MSRHPTPNIVRNVRRISDCQPGSEFVFKMPDGRELGKAKNIIEFITLVKRVPIESLAYHVNSRHFGGWLELIGETAAAEKISKLGGSGEAIRTRVISSI